MASSKQKLSTYRAKRDFTKTAEPSGAHAVAKSERLRYVIQKHAARRLHYDLRLELDGVFKSWAVTRGPSLEPAEKRLAVEVEDHPLDYGDFEGTIPQGQYGGGTVMLWDRGYWSPDEDRPPQESIKKGELKFSLQGERLYGSWVLVRMRNDRYGGKRNNWLLIKHRDTEKVATPKSMAEDRSVASGRSMEQIAAGKGRGPKPFMLRGKAAAKADAVWQSNRSEAQEETTSTATSGRRRAAQKGMDVGFRRNDIPSARAGNKSLVHGKKISRLPDFIEPQLCKLLDKPPPGDRWLHEIKFDGYRMQLRVQNHRASMKTRKGLDWTAKFASIAKLAEKLPDCIIDGEVVAVDARGMPNFSALQNALSEGRSDKLIFFVFDLLFVEGEDLRSLALVDRKQRLRELLRNSRTEAHLRYVDHFAGSAAEVWQSACQMALEGIISKLANAPYVSGRGNGWTKTKCRAGQEVIIGGWTTESGMVRSLLVGVMKGKRLIYSGRVGTGFSESKAGNLAKRLKALATEDSPFGGENAPRKEKNVHWVKPELVAEIEFAGWTDGGSVRQAAFKGLREDKPAKEVQAEKPVSPERALKHATTSSPRRKPGPMSSKSLDPGVRRGDANRVGDANRRGDEVVGRGDASREKNGATNIVMGVTISNADKKLWPDAGDGKPVTKLDLARYFEDLADWILPHIKGRPCSLVRMPDGIGGQKFFQRHGMESTSELLTLTKVSGDRKPYLQIDRADALAAVAQTAAMELHPWNCAPDRVDTPGRLVFDLDPAPDVGFDAVVKAALEMRERLEALGLICFCKTTGGKGLHVVTPLRVPRKGALDWPTAKLFAQTVCTKMAEDSPGEYLINMAKKQRVGRIFLDYLRNDRMSTAVAPLSPRARDGATVSMPLNWKQVRAGLDPGRFTVRTAAAALKKDKPWQDYCDSEQPLDQAIKKLTKQ